MTDSFRSTPAGQAWSGSSPAGNGGYQNPGQQHEPPAEESGEIGKALLIGLLGGLVSAAGYMIYRRLPDEQRDRINNHVRGMVQERINEVRQNFNI